MSTRQRKSPSPVAAGTEARIQKTRTSNDTAKPADEHRQLQRFLSALLERDLSTLEAQKAAGCSRPANLATEARKRYCLMLPCTLTRYIKADGSPANYGVYQLTASDRERLAEIGFGAGR